MLAEQRRWRKRGRAVFAWLLVMMFIITSIPVSNYGRVAAAQSEYSFDFGANGTQSGFIGVSASDGYDAAKGYGFNTPSNMANVSASGSGELSDAVQFKSTDGSNTFNVDLPTGLYEITVYLGNTMRTSIWAEDCMQVVNMTGNNAKHTWQMPVTDGQLNIRATAGKEGYAFTMSSLIIRKLSDDPKMSQTVWICGDSTVCNYYPLDTSVQGGWGQMLDQYIDTNKWQVRNMAASGQYAKGFVDAGQFTPILKYGKSGDVYIISIGINDTNYSNSTEYHDTVYDMAKQAMEKGMKVVLVKQQGRADDISRSKLLTGRWFGGELDTIGEELGVQVVDLFNLAQDYYLSIGQDAVYNLYMSGDTLHPNREGAKVLARLMSEQIDFAGIKETVDGSRYYAVDASYENAVFEDYNLGYSGRGYVNFHNMIGSNITFTVDVEETGNYLVTFRIANGSVNDRAMKIEVNDGSDYWIQPFTSTGNYTTWEERGIVLPLHAGTNKMKATAVMSEGGPNLDYIELDKTDEPIAEVYQPEQTTQAPTVMRNTTVYIAGDSTAQSYRASYAPQQGWGYYLQNYLGDYVTVANHAIAGRSSKSFYDNGRLTTILNEIQAGDYLLVQFGINDSSTKEERYAPVCGSVDNATDGSFEYYMKMYIQGALDKGAIPVLVSPTLGLKAYSNGSFVNSYTNYADAMRNLSNYYNVPFIDMNTLMVQNYNSVGYDAAKLYHLYGVVEGSTDMTHFSEAGADNAARLLSTELNQVIAKYTPVPEGTTQIPATEAPVTTQEPATEAPVTTQEPATEVPVTTQEPATEAPVTTQEPTTEMPETTQMPATEEEPEFPYGPPVASTENPEETTENENSTTEDANTTEHDWDRPTQENPATEEEPEFPYGPPAASTENPEEPTENENSTTEDANTTEHDWDRPTQENPATEEEPEFPYGPPVASTENPEEPTENENSTTEEDADTTEDANTTEHDWNRPTQENPATEEEPELPYGPPAASTENPEEPTEDENSTTEEDANTTEHDWNRPTQENPATEEEPELPYGPPAASTEEPEENENSTTEDANTTEHDWNRPTQENPATEEEPELPYGPPVDSTEEPEEPTENENDTTEEDADTTEHDWNSPTKNPTTEEEDVDIEETTEDVDGDEIIDNEDVTGEETTENTSSNATTEKQEGNSPVTTQQQNSVNQAIQIIPSQPDATTAVSNAATTVVEDAQKLPVFTVGSTFAIPALNAVVKFTSCTVTGGSVTYLAPITEEEEVVIPDIISINGQYYKVTAIADKALYNCKKVKKITIGSKVKKIGKKAFYKCKNVKQITIKTAKLKAGTIGKQAFKGLSKKVKVKVPKNRKKLYQKILKAKGLGE